MRWGLFCLTISVAPACAPQTPERPVRSVGGAYHTVRPGETLYRIGKAYDVRYEELARLNNLPDPDKIHVGQRLFIPGASRELPVAIITPVPMPFDSSTVPDAAEMAPFEPVFVWPINGTINSAYGPRGSSFHDGIDIAAPHGTPIRAIESGEVIFSDTLRGYGNIVILQHSGGFVSVYAHNESNLVRSGQQVSRGEIIARVGSTGRVTGPHLHFEIRRNNRPLDPLSYMPR
jgi:murein DD-endopeptidase MepM/ murein hydrolase activator NlpD